MNRELGTQVISAYLSIPKNIEILEKRIALCATSPEDYLKRVYECVGYMTHGWVKEYHADIKEKRSGFSLNAFYDFIELETETDNFLAEEIDVEEGALTCPRCSSCKTFSYTKQVRSADEGTSVFARCYNCGNKWRES